MRARWSQRERRGARRQPHSWSAQRRCSELSPTAQRGSALPGSSREMPRVGGEGLGSGPGRCAPTAAARVRGGARAAAPGCSWASAHRLRARMRAAGRLGTCFEKVDTNVWDESPALSPSLPSVAEEQRQIRPRVRWPSPSPPPPQAMR